MERGCECNFLNDTEDKIAKTKAAFIAKKLVTLQENVQKIKILAKETIGQIILMNEREEEETIERGVMVEITEIGNVVIVTGCRDRGIKEDIDETMNTDDADHRPALPVLTAKNIHIVETIVQTLKE